MNWRVRIGRPDGAGDSDPVRKYVRLQARVDMIQTTDRGVGMSCEGCWRCREGSIRSTRYRDAIAKSVVVLWQME